MRKKVPLCSGCVHNAWPMIVHVLGLSCLLVLTSLTVKGQAELIKDIDLREEILNNEYRALTAGSSQVYFVSANTLWKTSGTPETTIQLKSFRYVHSIFVIGNAAYLAADEGSGVELWKSNGTPAGTVLVKDIWPGNDGSNPQNFTNVNGTLYFTADNGKNGRELWKSNGTSGSTVMVKDILAVVGSSSPSGLTNLNGTLFFSANDASHGYELWKSNGTAGGTVMVTDIRPGAKSSSAPKFITRSNGMIFFTADDDAGRELWRSDGTEAGTVLVKDITMGDGSDVENLIDVNGTLFFTANDGIHGDELWKSNGTGAGTVLVKDMNPGSAGSNGTGWFSRQMSNFRSFNSKLFFIASEGSTGYIYRSDGTEDGTIRISIALGTGMNDPQPYFTYMQGHVYFFNVENDEKGSLYLWKIHVNGTTATKVREFHTPRSYSEYYYYENYDHAMVESNNLLYIAGRISSYQGFKLIRSDGTNAGTQVITDTHIRTLGSNPSDMVSVNDIVFFRTMPDPYEYVYAADYDYASEELYRTDGTAEGTYKMPGWFQDWNEMEKVGNTLFYTVENGGWELNKTDGNTISNVKIGETGEGRPMHLTAVGNYLYYTNGFGELWKSDGTSQGTVMIKDMVKINSISDVSGLAYILAETPTGGLELWRTTAGGSIFRIKTLRTTAAKPSLHNPTATDGIRFYFIANDGIHGNEIWKSEGAESTTFMIRDLNQNDPSTYYNVEFDIESMALVNGSLVFSAIDQNNNWLLYTYTARGGVLESYDMGYPPKNLKAHNNKVYFVSSWELYATDGSSEPFMLAALGSYPEHTDYAVIDDLLYVSVSPYNTNIWQTDGTECGTVEIYTGIDSPFPIEPSGNNMIMGGASNLAGREPHVYRNITEILPPCYTPAMATSASASEESVMTPYPNPFTNDFTLRVNGNDDEVAEVGVYTFQGLPVDKFENVKTNTEYPNIGSQWPKGVYFVKVNKGGKLTSHTVVKK